MKKTTVFTVLMMLSVPTFAIGRADSTARLNIETSVEPAGLVYTLNHDSARGARTSMFASFLTGFNNTVAYEFPSNTRRHVYIGGNIGAILVGANIGMNIELFKTRLYDFELNLDLVAGLSASSPAIKPSVNLLWLSENRKRFYIKTGISLMHVQSHGEYKSSEEESGAFFNMLDILAPTTGIGFKI